MFFLLDGKVMNFQSRHQRTIVRVFIDGIPGAQLFYRSTGNSSGMPKTFLPFDGLVDNGLGKVWYDKTRFTRDPEQPWNKYGFGELHRFGTLTMKRISDALGKMNIPEGNLTTNTQEINDWINEPFDGKWEIIQC
jgi:hypothetical protein